MRADFNIYVFSPFSFTSLSLLARNKDILRSLIVVITLLIEEAKTLTKQFFFLTLSTLSGFP